MEEAAAQRALKPRGKCARVLAAFGLLAVLFYLAPPLPERYRDLRANLSLRLTDRDGRPLRALLSKREGTDAWVPLSDIAPELVEAVLISEDRRFRHHPGVDPLAVARAVKSNLLRRQVVSGASTLTQQLLRTLETAPGPRDLKTKLTEAYWATRLELVTSKDEILEAYLNRVPFAPGVYGVEEAARYFFDKPARALSLAESVHLAVLLRAPSTFDLFTSEGRAELKPWTDDLLRRMSEQGAITPAATEAAHTEPLALSHLPPPFLAPHFCDLVLPRTVGLRGAQATTLDLPLQQAVEGMVSNHLRLLAAHHVDNAAVIVAEVETGQVLALAGSAGFHRQNDGQHNAAVSLRQPGSTLKPFTYALLLGQVGQAGFILPDLPLYRDSHQRGYIPENYDGKFHGPVSVRTSLGSSYNVPAVRALEMVGVENLLTLLRGLGMTSLDQAPDHYGLGLTLGDGSVSLWQLVEAYRTLARHGRHGPLRMLATEASPKESQALTPEVADLVTDVLADRQARIPSFGTPNALEFPFPVAVKTGTSKGYRDNWCVGYTPRHIVGVWVGNSDGSAMRSVSGIAGAGPLFRDVVLSLGDGGEFSLENLVPTRICSLSGQTANNHCPQTRTEHSLPGTAVPECSVCRLDSKNQLVFHLDPLYREWAVSQRLPLPAEASNSTHDFRFVYPLDGDVFLPDHDLRATNQRVRLRTAGGQAPYRWWVDGRELSGPTGPDTWWQLQPGRHQIRVRDSEKREARLFLRVVKN